MRKNVKIISFMIFFMGVVLILYVFNNKTPEINVKGGILSGYSREEIEAMTNKKADKNAFSFELNARPIFENGKSEGNLRIANPPYSLYTIEVEVYLDKSDKLIFKSGKINPNHYIESAKLLKTLKKGKHPATAIIKAYDIKTKEYKGKSAAGVVMEVKN